MTDYPQRPADEQPTDQPAPGQTGEALAAARPPSRTRPRSRTRASRAGLRRAAPPQEYAQELPAGQQYPPQDYTPAGLPAAAGLPPAGIPAAAGVPAEPGPPPVAADERTWAVAAHLSPFLASFVGLPFLGPLVIYLVFRDRGPFVRHHAAQALNFQIIVMNALVVFGLLSLALVGIPFSSPPAWPPSSSRSSRQWRPTKASGTATR